MTSERRPAFYALAPGGWRDYVTLLHPPYTLWHLAYVALGAGLAPELHVERLLAALAAFFLAVGVGAHALVELHGRPLGTPIPKTVLWALAAVSLVGAVAIGVASALAWTPWLFAFIAGGTWIVLAYNLELLGGRLHTDAWFALGWGSFPVLTGYFVVAERISVEALLAGTFALFLSLAQRRLSTQVRTVRRRTRAVMGTVELKDGRREPLTAESLTRAPEAALRALTCAVVAVSAALLALRL